MKQGSKALIKLAEQLGYEHTDTNSQGALRYTHPSAPDVVIQTSLPEYAARALQKRMLASTGNSVKKPKRNPRAVRERQSRDRETQRQEKAKREAVLAGLIAERSRMLAGHASGLTLGQVAAIEKAIEQAEREVSRYERLMTELPSSADHSGTSRSARHRAGAA